MRADQCEREQRMAAYRSEYRRWRERLADRPDDIEMANWLDCDRLVLRQRAMLAYRLKWRDVREYALFVLEGVAAEGRRWWSGPAYRRAS